MQFESDDVTDLPPDFIAKNQEMLEKQIVLAGIRLADKLKVIYEHLDKNFETIFGIYK